MQSIYLTIVLAPLLACIIAGLFGKSIGRIGAHSVTILGVAISCALSFVVLYKMLFDGIGAVQRHGLYLAAQPMGCTWRWDF